MISEKRIPLEIPAGARADKGYILNPGEEVNIVFETKHSGNPVSRRLRVNGEVDFFWRWRQESGIPQYCYPSIEDALDTDDAYGEKYCLKISGTGEKYPRNAYLKVFKADLFPGENYKFEVFAKAENLELDPAGEVTVEVGIYLEKEGRHENDAFDQPDVIKAINFPAGTYNWKSFCADFSMPDNAVLLLIRIGAKGFNGNIKFATPVLHSQGQSNCVPYFCANNSLRPQYNWVGENLSRKERPEFEIKIDGQEVFKGQKFNAIYRWPDFEVDLPELSDGKHNLFIKFLADYDSALPFVLKSAELLEHSAREFEVIAFPEHVPAGTDFAVFVKTCEANVELNISCAKNVAMKNSQITLSDAGYHVLTFSAKESGVDSWIQLTSKDHSERIVIRQILLKQDDGVMLSTGDAVFIPQDADEFMRYLEWYTANRIGNSICFRSAYRWSGSRELNPDAWKTVIPYLEKLQLPYLVMVDGRELPGKNANPPDSLLDGPYYMGRQAHENDGSFCYWGNELHTKDVPETYADIISRSIDKGGIQPGVRPVRKADKTSWFFDQENADDVKTASELFVENLKNAKADSTRHTGPSTLFRYFYQAGYEILGAEQMYGPEEIILSSLRGASNAYGKDTTGSHLALQWGSIPHDTSEHAKRYFLSLATCYLQGVKQINLEEGLWRMEKGYVDSDRFSRSCQRHLTEHTKFRQFMESHERRGKQRVPIAVLQGRYDGWRCFGRGNVWMREGEQWKFGLPEESFDLLNVFYPRSILADIYKNDCPVAPHGWYTGTPYGVVDLVPIEAPAKLLETYKVIAFLGWNTFNPDDFKKLLEFVKNGGSLILSKPHLSINIKRNLPSELSPDKTLYELLGRDFEDATGIIKRKVGKGKLTYFADDSYPADSQIREAYENELKTAAIKIEQVECAKGWMHGNDDVNFTAYEWADGKTRTLYALNIDWWSGKSTVSAKLLLGNKKFDISTRAGCIETITVSKGIAVMPLAMNMDIVEITADEISLQSASGGEIKIFEELNAKVSTLKVPSGFHTVKLSASK